MPTSPTADEHHIFTLQRFRASFRTLLSFQVVIVLLGVVVAAVDPAVRSRFLHGTPMCIALISLRTWLHWRDDQQQGPQLYGYASGVCVVLREISVYATADGDTSAAAFLCSRVVIIIGTASANYIALPTSHQVAITAIIAGASCFMHPPISEMGRPLEPTLTCAALLLGGAVGVNIEEAHWRSFKRNQIEKRQGCKSADEPEKAPHRTSSWHRHLWWPQLITWGVAGSALLSGLLGCYQHGASNLISQVRTWCAISVCVTTLLNVRLGTRRLGQAYCIIWCIGIGVSGEIFATYRVRLTQGAHTMEYAEAWVNAFAFYLMMAVSSPFAVSVLNVDIGLSIWLPMQAYLMFGGLLFSIWLTPWEESALPLLTMSVIANCAGLATFVSHKDKLGTVYHTFLSTIAERHAAFLRGKMSRRRRPSSMFTLHPDLIPPVLEEDQARKDRQTDTRGMFRHLARAWSAQAAGVILALGAWRDSGVVGRMAAADVDTLFIASLLCRLWQTVLSCVGVERCVSRPRVPPLSATASPLCLAATYFLTLSSACCPRREASSQKT